MFRDKFLVSLAPEHHLGSLHGERQLSTRAISALCRAGVKPDLPPGGRSHYSKDGFQFQELSEKAGHELQTPSDEPDRKMGDWHDAKPEPRSHHVAQLHAHHRGTACCRNETPTSRTPARGSPNPADPKSKATKMKKTHSPGN